MATRNFPTDVQTNLLKEVTLNVTLLGQGSGKAPKLSTGDPNGAFFNQPVYVSTGVFTLTTVDGYPNPPASGDIAYVVASPAYNTTVVEGPAPTQSTTATATAAAGAWTFTFNAFTTGSAADVLTTDLIRVLIVFSNTGDPYAG